MHALQFRINLRKKLRFDEEVCHILLFMLLLLIFKFWFTLQELKHELPFYATKNSSPLHISARK